MPADLNFLAVIAFAILVLAAIFIVLFRALLVRGGTPRELDFEPLPEFSLEHYRPLRRLMGEADFRFLESQPGYSPEIGKCLRAERRQILMEYLDELSGEFHRLLRAGRTMIVLSTSDQADFAGALSQIRNEFYWNLFLARTSIALPGCSARVERLISAMALLSDHVQALQIQLPSAS